MNTIILLIGIVALGLVIYIFIDIFKNKKVVGVYTCKNGGIVNKYVNRLEILLPGSIGNITFTSYDISDIEKFSNEAYDFMNKFNDVKEIIAKYLNDVGKDIGMNIKEWNFVDVNLDEYEDGNISVIINTPKNKEIKWGISLDINFRTNEISNFELCH